MHHKSFFKMSTEIGDHPDPVEFVPRMAMANTKLAEPHFAGQAG
jgi:hypothetical protein